MKIWIDFINTPQISFWVPFIRELKKENHEIVLTCRDSGNTIALLEQNDLDYTVIGKNVGKSILQKIMFFPKRLYELYKFVKKLNPDVAVSQSSFYQPIVARILRVKCLYTNDNEHAKGNLLGFFFANKVILPIALQQEKFTYSWFLKSKLSFYPSVKEAIYLSQRPELLDLIKLEKNTIYFRPEPWSAQYYNGPLNFFDQMILRLSEEYKTVILPRDKNQVKHYQQQKFKKVVVAAKPLKLPVIISNCLLFIGAGGSMTRELAVLGIPVVSIYQADLLCVDKYLVDNGNMVVRPNISLEEIKEIIGNTSVKPKKVNTLEDGKKSFEIIMNMIVDLQ